MMLDSSASIEEEDKDRKPLIQESAVFVRLDDCMQCYVRLQRCTVRPKEEDDDDDNVNYKNDTRNWIRLYCHQSDYRNIWHICMKHRRKQNVISETLPTSTRMIHCMIFLHCVAFVSRHGSHHHSDP